MSSRVKRFEIIGEVRKPSAKIPFHKMINALKKEHAIEQVLSDMGSKHKAKRYEIAILEIKEHERPEG